MLKQFIKKKSHLFKKDCIWREKIVDLLENFLKCQGNIQLEEVKSKKAGHVQCIRATWPCCRIKSYIDQREGTCYIEESVTSLSWMFAFVLMLLALSLTNWNRCVVS